MQGADILESFATNNGEGPNQGTSATETISESLSDRQNPGVTNESSQNVNAPKVAGTNAGSLSKKQHPESGFSKDVVQEIESAVKLFRTGNLTKVEAILLIHQSLSTESTIEFGIRKDALERYGQTLDQIESNVTRANERGQK